MATWSDVELLTNEDTNTVRLDSVSGEEHGSGLYQVDTLVKISSFDKVISANVCITRTCIVVIDKTVILFDQNYQTILLLLHFETDVDTIDVCLDGRFLVVCERNGNLHLIYVPHKRILFTRKSQILFLVTGMYHVFLLIKDGFFHISNLALTKIETGIEYLCWILCSTYLEPLFKHSKLYFTLLLCKHVKIWTWEWNGNELLVLTLRLIFTGVRKLVVMENLLYILDSEDVLSVWDLHFLVMIRCWPELAIHDFELTTECGSASMVIQLPTAFLKIYCFFTFQISSLQIRCLPSMSVCYSLDVSSVSCLVQMKTNMDTIYLVEGICENPESRGEAVVSVVVRCFTEALPENRLSRLLHKHMFEEAEKFAITFDLDLELVYKVKLDFVLEQLASASVGGYGQEVWSELVDEAKTNLMKITDEQYVVDYCLKAPWPTFDTAEKMLNHAASRYASLQIQEALARLATFCSLHGVENFNGIAWIEFLNSTDILGDVLTHLREGDMRGAQLLWLRYEIALEFKEKSLEAVLGAIPEDLPSQDLCPWFRTVFVPFVRRVLPRGQRILAKWLELKARNLELTEKGSWPQNGLDLAIIGLPSLWTWMKSIDDSDGANELQSLRSLVSNLRQLLDLHHKYSCRLSLSVFEKVCLLLSVAFFMLDKVPAPELIAATVERSVRPYAEEHALPFDELLLQYIKDLLERCSSQTTTLFTGWEGKAVAVLSCMTDTDVKLEHIFCRLPSRRAVHMLQSYPVDDAIRLLSPILFPLSSSGPRLTFCHRTRVLLCLIRLADAETLEAQLQIPRSKFKCYLKSYIFVSQLEALNIPYTVQSFLSSPKDGLVKGLWRNHSHEPQAVRLVADLCLEYQVYDPQLWNSLLQKLLGFNLIGHLQTVLEAIVAVPALWEVLLQLASVLELYVLILFFIFCRCPFLLNLDLIGIANRFAQFNLHAFALGTLLLIPCAHKKAQQIQGFLSMCNPVAVLEQVDEFMNTGELAGIPSQIRETVLQFISQNGQHQKVMKTKHFAHLKQLVVSSGQPNQLKELVECLISQNW
uniref:Kinetochore associated 1 n=1 Tax=Poecilia latipinna TaxID=48699 RepID=A0A3B3VKC0_9TELE